MPLKTKRWNDPVEKDDGYRLLICRYRPRGVKKTDETWDAGTRTLAGHSKVVGGDDYELRIVVPEGSVVVFAGNGEALALGCEDDGRGPNNASRGDQSLKETPASAPSNFTAGSRSGRIGFAAMFAATARSFWWSKRTPQLTVARFSFQASLK